MKVFVIQSIKDHFWKSCQIIEQHIKNALDQSRLDIEFLEAEDALNLQDLHKIKEQAQRTIANIYFLSDMVKIEKVCEQLHHIHDLHYIIPVYGNMTMETNRWRDLSNILKGRKVSLIGASHRSCQQIDALTNDCRIKMIPYPFEQQLVKYANHDADINIVYAGRLNPEKNILTLIECFLEAKKFNSKLKLHIAGGFHERCYHLHGYPFDFKEYKTKILNLFEQNKEDVIYYGALSQEELLKLFAKQDYFISLSVYHDEDFGFSAAQACAVGTKVILSDWGGHGQFIHNSFLIPIKEISKNIPQVDAQYLVKKLIALVKNTHHDEFYKDYFSYKRFIKSLESLIMEQKRTYLGQSDLFNKYEEESHHSYVLSSLYSDQSIYRSIYDNYLKDIKKKTNF